MLPLLGVVYVVALAVVVVIVVGPLVALGIVYLLRRQNENPTSRRP